jgi:hypothetical protein
MAGKARGMATDGCGKVCWESYRCGSAERLYFYFCAAAWRDGALSPSS